MDLSQPLIFLPCHRLLSRPVCLLHEILDDGVSVSEQDDLQTKAPSEPTLEIVGKPHVRIYVLDGCLVNEDLGHGVWNMRCNVE